MPTRDPYAGSASPGDIYTAANHAKMPGGWVAYEYVTTNPGGTTILFAEATFTLPAARVLRVTAYQPIYVHYAMTGSPVENQVTIIYDPSGAATVLQEARHYRDDAALGIIEATLASYVGEFTSGSHTIRVEETWGDRGDLDANKPGYLLIEDLGPAPV